MLVERWPSSPRSLPSVQLGSITAWGREVPTHKHVFHPELWGTGRAIWLGTKQKGADAGQPAEQRVVAKHLLCGRLDLLPQGKSL